MRFKNRRLKASTAVIVLVSFVWMTAGGNVWAEGRAVDRDPAKVLLRLAEDPRLALAPQEKEYLRRAAHRLESEPRQQQTHVFAGPVAADPAAEMREVAGQLGRLAARAGSPAKAQGPGDAEALAALRSRLEAIDKRVL